MLLEIKERPALWDEGGSEMLISLIRYMELLSLCFLLLPLSIARSLPLLFLKHTFITLLSSPHVHYLVAFVE